MSGPVVITGFGCVSISGEDRAALGASLDAGRSEVRLAGPDPADWSLRAVRPDLGSRVPKLKLRRLDPTMQRVLRASYEALEAAGLVVADAPERTGVVTGTGYAGCGSSIEFMRTHWTDGPELADPARFPNTVPNGPTGQLTIFLGTRGPCTNFFDSGNSGESALEYARGLLLDGRADSMLVAGIDERSEPVVEIERVYRRTAGRADPAGLLRPFDADRSGTVLGEVSAALVLETGSAALARGATPLATLGPVAETAEPTPPGHAPRRPELLAEVIRRALDGAGVGADDVAFVNTSGRGAPDLDALEAAALREVFGPRLTEVPVAAPFAYTGDLTAGGVFRAAVSLHALASGRVPAVARTPRPDPSLGLRVAAGGEPVRTPHVLHVGTGLGACHTAFVLSA